MSSDLGTLHHRLIWFDLLIVNYLKNLSLDRDSHIGCLNVHIDERCVQMSEKMYLKKIVKSGIIIIIKRVN